MAWKGGFPVDTNAPVTNSMKPDTEGEYWEQTWRDLQQCDAGKTVEDTKALQPNSQYALLFHTFWADFAWLLVNFAVNEFSLAPIAVPCSPESSV
ncbi:MAG: hypothetical protein Q9175_003350 [Cornicularia normoerica]